MKDEFIFFIHNTLRDHLKKTCTKKLVPENFPFLVAGRARAMISMVIQARVPGCLIFFEVYEKSVWSGMRSKLVQESEHARGDRLSFVLRWPMMDFIEVVPQDGAIMGQSRTVEAGGNTAA